MSIASELTRLQEAKSDLSAAIAAKGVPVPASATLDEYAALVADIQAGSGGSVVTGAYVGDGTSMPRSISLGFTPSAVLIVRQDGMTGESGSTYGGLAVTGHEVVTDLGIPAVTVADGGFLVANMGDSHVNDDTMTYHYVAWQ